MPRPTNGVGKGLKMSLLDEYFPRPEPKQRPQPAPEQGVIEQPQRWAVGPQPKTTKRDPNRVTAKQLERIGEGLASYVLGKFGIVLYKIPLVEGYYGYTSIDVDFQGAYQGRPLKVEAKAWWSERSSTFALSRFSKNERRYMGRGLAQGFQCWITIALLDTEPTRGACNHLYVVPWSDWLIIEGLLGERAGGNFKGRSMRVRDIDLLDGYAIVRDGRRWVLPARHWLADAPIL